LLPLARRRGKATAHENAKGKHEKAKGKVKCVVYLRTSSAANVGEDKDSEPRQREKCRAYAERKGLETVQEFRDPAVSGTDPIINRAGFSSLVAFCVDNGVNTILVEQGDRFARDLMVQEIGIKWLAEVDIQVICVDNEAQFTNPGCTGALVRQMLGAVSEFVAAQDRERLLHGRNKALSKVASDPRGRRSYANMPKLGGPMALLEKDVALANAMRAYAKMPAHKMPSLAIIAVELKAKNNKWSVKTGKNAGRPWSAKQIRTFMHKFV
jgi:DNA invertase Pin-like site-specific DNA recombinase